MVICITHGHTGAETWVAGDQIARIEPEVVILRSGERFQLVSQQQYQRLVRQVERMAAR